MHDPGMKKFLGRTGRFDGEDIINIILSQPQASLFISSKLWKFFAEQQPSPELQKLLAEEFKRGAMEFKPFLTAVFKSEAFYQPGVMKQQVKSPTYWLVSSIQLLERSLPPINQTQQILKTLGQELFNPPNVKGWDGGLAWITTNNLLARYNYSSTLVFSDTADLEKSPRARRRKTRDTEASAAPATVRDLIPAEALTSAEKTVAALEKRFMVQPLKEQQRKSLIETLEKRKAPLSEDDYRQVVRLMMCTPEFQLT
jgi:uncharacterized protein (DUF1800 family)